MDLINNYGTGLILKALENIEEKIFNSSCYLYFDNSDSTLIQEYKKFETTIIATALVAVYFEIDIQNSEKREQLGTIYLGKTTDFQKILLSKELKIHDLNVSSYDISRQQSMLNLKIRAKFECYYKEILESIENKSVYYFIEYDTPERVWDSVYKTYTDEIIKGEDRLYRFLWNLFLCYENIDCEVFDYEQKCIDYKVFFMEEDTSLKMIDNFIKEMVEFNK